MKDELINYMNYDIIFFLKINQKMFTCVFVYVGPMDVEVDLGKKVGN
jgi:hypothetical protein